MSKQKITNPKQTSKQLQKPKDQPKLKLQQKPSIKLPSQVHLSKQQQRHLQQMFNANKIIQYFNTNNQQIDSNKREKAILFLLQAQNYLNTQIAKGNISIAQQRNDINDLVQEQKQRILQRAEPKFNQYQLKQHNLKMYRQQINKKLKYLDQQIINPSQVLDPQSHPNAVLSKQEHQQLVAKIIKQRKQRDKQHRKYLKNLKENQAKKQKQRQQSQEKHLQEQLQQRRKKIQENLQKKKQQHQKFISLQKQTTQKYNQVKSKKPLFQQIQQRYQGAVIRSLQQKKKKLKQLRDLKRGLNISQLLQHQKQYLQKRQNSLHTSRSQNSDHDKSWSYKPPQRSQKLSRIIQQQKIQFRRQQQQKKRSVQQKINRQRAFLQQLKFKHQPQPDPAKQQQIRRRIQQKIVKKPDIDPKIQGVSYLQFAKLMKKKQKRSQTQQKTTRDHESQKNAQRQKNQKRKSISRNVEQYRIQKQYEQIRRRKIDSVTNSNKPMKQKLNELEIQNQKLDEQVKRSQQLMKVKNDYHFQQKAMEVILTSIKAKIGIIDVLKN